MITLKPAHFAGSFYSSPSWLTNGHWAVKRDRCSNGAALNIESAGLFFGSGANKVTMKREMTDADVAKAAKASGSAQWTVTRFRHESDRGLNTIILVSAAGGHTAIDAKYAAALGIMPGNTLYGHENGLSALSDSPEPETLSFVLMPVRSGVDDDALAAFAGVIGAKLAKANKGRKAA